MIFSLNGDSLRLKRKVGSQVPINSLMETNNKNRELPIPIINRLGRQERLKALVPKIESKSHYQE